MKGFLGDPNKPLNVQHLYVGFLQVTQESLLEISNKLKQQIKQGKKAEEDLPGVLNWLEQLDQELYLKEKEIQDASNSSEIEAANKELQEDDEEQQEEGLPE